jgi:hypothetical protein
MNGNGAIAPRIIKLMAPVGNKKQVGAKLARGLIEASRLVAQFACKKQNPFTRHNRSHEPVGRDDRLTDFFSNRSDGNQLIASRLCAAVPRLAQERHRNVAASFQLQLRSV